MVERGPRERELLPRDRAVIVRVDAREDLRPAAESPSRSWIGWSRALGRRSPLLTSIAAVTALAEAVHEVVARALGQVGEVDLRRRRVAWWGGGAGVAGRTEGGERARRRWSASRRGVPLFGRARTLPSPFRSPRFATIIWRSAMSTLPSWFRSRCAPVRARQRLLAVRLRLLTAGAGDKWPTLPLRFTPTAEHLVGEALNVPRQVGHVHLAVAVGVERFQERPKRRGVDALGASARHAEKHGEPGLCRKRFGAVIMISTVDSFVAASTSEPTDPARFDQSVRAQGSSSSNTQSPRRLAVPPLERVDTTRAQPTRSSLPRASSPAIPRVRAIRGRGDVRVRVFSAWPPTHGVLRTEKAS